IYRECCNLRVRIRGRIGSSPYASNNHCVLSMIDEYDYRLVIRRDRLGDAKRSRGSTVMIDVLVVARIACQAFGVQLIVYSRSYSPGITAEIIGNIRKRKW